MNWKVRQEVVEDHPGIRAVHDLAFGQSAEGEVVEFARLAGASMLSLVATTGHDVIGHVLFTPARVQPSSSAVAALGPLGVVPAWQRRGVGTELVRVGLEHLRALGLDGVVVLGDPRYYTRFGFQPASGYGLTPAQAWPREAFQAIELRPSALGTGGTVHYHPAFDKVS